MHNGRRQEIQRKEKKNYGFKWRRGWRPKKKKYRSPHEMPPRISNDNSKYIKKKNITEMPLYVRVYNTATLPTGSLLITFIIIIISNTAHISFLLFLLCAFSDWSRPLWRDCLGHLDTVWNGKKRWRMCHQKKSCRQELVSDEFFSQTKIAVVVAAIIIIIIRVLGYLLNKQLSFSPLRLIYLRKPIVHSLADREL